MGWRRWRSFWLGPRRAGEAGLCGSDWPGGGGGLSGQGLGELVSLGCVARTGLEEVEVFLARASESWSRWAGLHWLEQRKCRSRLAREKSGPEKVPLVDHNFLGALAGIR